MPELPEVETSMLSIKDDVLNKRIEDVIIRETKLREPINKELNNIKNEVILDIKRRGKYLILFISGGHEVIIHLGMSGSLTLQKKTSQMEKHSHVDICLNDIVLRFNDPRKFGMVIHTTNHLENKYIQNCGLEPFDESFTQTDYLFNIGKKKKTNIKNLIMQNKIVVGVGNIYASEVLFKTKINPQEMTCNITKEQYKLLSHNIVKVLKDSIKNKGTTLKDHKVGKNETGQNQFSLNVYSQEICKVCKNKISKIQQNNRTTYFCETCQPMLK